MNEKRKDPNVCSAKFSGLLDTKMRKLIQNPKKILSPYIKKNMVVLDMGCGPGFFTIEISEMLNGTGKVIAADLQEDMLFKLEEKIKKFKLNNIELHKAEKDSINLKEKVDFILVFYMLHEVPNQKNFINELKDLLKDHGKILISEPKFGVTKKSFEKSVDLIKDSGFTIIETPNIFISHSILLKKTDT